MILLDANILLYAHGKVRAWLQGTLDGTESIGVPWLSAWAFLRISTNVRLHQNPMTTMKAMAILSDRMEHPMIRMIDSGPRHATLLGKHLRASRLAGKEVTDVVLVALAEENGARLASTDGGFRRFSGIDIVNPI